MAIVNIKFDTASKDLEVTFDGEAIANAESICISKRGSYYSDSDKDEGFSFNLLTLDKNNDEGYKTYKQVVAKNTLEGREFLSSGGATLKDHDEFVYKAGVSERLKKSIANYLRNR